MKAMILAAGVGSRLDPLTRNLPKPMVPIVNKPVMEHIVELLARHGFTDIMVNLHYLGDQIQNFFGNGAKWGVNIQYSEEDRLWGDAGSVKRCEDFFDGTFLVIGADDLADINLTRLIQVHKEKNAAATIALSIVEDPSEYGIALIDEDDRVVKFVEKPRTEVFSNTANTGVYVFEPEILELIPRGVEYGLGKNLLPFLLQQQRRFNGHITSSYWSDVGNLKQYLKTHEDVMDGRVSIDLQYDQQSKGVWRGENVTIHPSAVIESPVIIGNNCRIEEGARLLQYSVLGDDCVLEKNACVRQSILWQGASVMEKTVLERCVVGTGCRVQSNAAVFGGVIVDPIRHNGG